MSPNRLKFSVFPFVMSPCTVLSLEDRCLILEFSHLDQLPLRADELGILLFVGRVLVGYLLDKADERPLVHIDSCCLSTGDFLSGLSHILIALFFCCLPPHDPCKAAVVSFFSPFLSLLSVCFMDDLFVRIGECHLPGCLHHS